MALFTVNHIPQKLQVKTIGDQIGARVNRVQRPRRNQGPIARPDTDAVVRIVDKGRVEGEIRAPGVIINGTVEGDVYSTHHLELAPKGRVHGNVFYTTVEMAAGSEVNGSLTHTVAAEALREKSPDPSVEVTEVSSGGSPLAESVAATKVD